VRVKRGFFLSLLSFLKVSHIVRPGETISSSAHERRVGGKGANQAVAIVRAGGKAGFFGTIGQDGLWLRERMEYWGVGTSNLLVSEVRFRRCFKFMGLNWFLKEPTGRAVIQVEQTGENSISMLSLQFNVPLNPFWFLQFYFLVPITADFTKKRNKDWIYTKTQLIYCCRMKSISAPLLLSFAVHERQQYF